MTLGVRLGIWGGPDGFGNTAEEEQARIEMMVLLCRDYEFIIFKFDSVVWITAYPAPYSEMLLSLVEET